MPFEISKIGKISKIAKISKASWRPEFLFSRVIFIVDFEYDLRIDKKFSIKPVGANLSIFRTFARTYLITLKLYQKIKDVILIKNHEKNWQYL